MKKTIALLASLLLTIALFGCSGPGGQETTATVDYGAIQDDMVSPDGTYEIAFVTDRGQLKDLSFSQSIWEGVKYYASQNGKTYKYYQPEHCETAEDVDRYNAMKTAVENGAKLVFCAGYLQEKALARIAAENPQVSFVFVDGYCLKDEQGLVLKNVAPVSFQEEQAGYLAGYAAVMEGYTSLGFSGGGAGINQACGRFGHGYLQGIQAAAAQKGIMVDVKFSWAYGSEFAASAKLQKFLSEWYKEGTQVIFTCGGLMCQSAFAAAKANNGKVIGVDVDQSLQSDTVITSATKGLHRAVEYMCQLYYEGKWNQVGGAQTILGAAQDAVGLPTTGWQLLTFTQEQYQTLLGKLKDGSIVVDASADFQMEAFPNIRLSVIPEPDAG